MGQLEIWVNVESWVSMRGYALRRGVLTLSFEHSQRANAATTAITHIGSIAKMAVTVLCLR